MTTPAPPDTSSTTAVARRRRWPLVVALTLAFCLFVAGGAVAGATVSFAEAQEGRLLPGTTVGGVDVSGMTAAQAERVVEEAAATELDRKIVVRWRNQRWKTTPRRLGSRSNAEAVIAETASLQTGLTWQDWAEVRWLGRQANVAAEVALTHSQDKVERFVDGIAEDVERRRRNAKMLVEDDAVVITPARVGYEAYEGLVLMQLMRNLRSGRHTPIALDVERIKPKVTEKKFSQVLLLDQSDHRLTLYLDGEAHKTWIVATGTGQYPTPIGRYEVSLKRYMPTWVNPDPDGWGASMPAVIPPGPNNPLGVRALNWSAPGAIRFHGTQAISSLGTSASHGCVRMSNTDVTELYDLVDEGAIIISQY